MSRKRTSTVREASKNNELELIKIEELQLMEPIGSGAFGQVYKARYKDKYVAVKFGDMNHKKDFAHELDLLSTISHPNIVELYGASAGTRFFLVLELGVTNLANYYKTHEYDLKELMNWTMQIAEAMNYLHAKRIVHRDLKTANILLDSKNYIKLCDFGTSRDFQLTTVMTFVGTISYMPPEMLKELPVSEKVDLYSFAVVLWELVTKQIPFSGWKPVQIIWFIAGENRRLPLPDDCPQFLRTMIEGCWREDPHERMTFSEVLTTLAQAITEKALEESSEDVAPLADDQRRWNLTINMTMEEYRHMKIISELDEIKKKDAELKERELLLQKREQELSKEVDRLQDEDNNHEAANLLRRIKTCPAPKKGAGRSSRFLVKTDAQILGGSDENMDLLSSPRGRTPMSDTPLSPSKPPMSPRSDSDLLLDNQVQSENIPARILSPFLTDSPPHDSPGSPAMMGESPIPSDSSPVHPIESLPDRRVAALKSAPTLGDSPIAQTPTVVDDSMQLGSPRSEHDEISSTSSGAVPTDPVLVE